jgi:hypothetical protein
VIITINDIRSAGHCVKGARGWFAQYDLDFRTFIRHGLDSATLLQTGDARAIDVVSKAEARRNGQIQT